VKDTSFTVGLQNIAQEDVDKVVNIIEDTLASVEAEGFPQQRIAAVLHSYELSLKHRSLAVFRIRIRIWIRMFLGLLDPHPVP
jgi:Zn-dependent M16 (insulinase) family peptidase